MRTTLTLDEDVAAKLKAEATGQVDSAVFDGHLVALAIEHCGGVFHRSRFRTVSWVSLQNPLES